MQLIFSGSKTKNADHLSRNGQLPTEWTPNRSIVLRLFQLWGHSVISLLLSNADFVHGLLVP